MTWLWSKFKQCGALSTFCIWPSVNDLSTSSSLCMLVPPPLPLLSFEMFGSAQDLSSEALQVFSSASPSWVFTLCSTLGSHRYMLMRLQKALDKVAGDSVLWHLLWYPSAVLPLGYHSSTHIWTHEIKLKPAEIQNLASSISSSFIQGKNTKRNIFALS